jgi:hypothetical protein
MSKWQLSHSQHDFPLLHGKSNLFTGFYGYVYFSSPQFKFTSSNLAHRFISSENSGLIMFVLTIWSKGLDHYLYVIIQFALATVLDWSILNYDWDYDLGLRHGLTVHPDIFHWEIWWFCALEAQEGNKLGISLPSMQ